jgi:hypothetical protein
MEKIMSKYKEALNKILKQIKSVSTKLKVEPSELTKAQFLGNAEGVTEWELRILGGFDSIKSTYFESDKDLTAVTASKVIKKHKSALDNKYGTASLFKEDFLSALKEITKTNKVPVYKTTKPNKVKVKDRSLVIHVSDTHFGANIESSEMGGANKFTWEVASRRMALLALQAVTYKPQYRDNTEAVICINGDIIAGMIHNQEWFADLLANQFAGALSILTQFVSYIAVHFPKTRVICTSGNHGRAMHKKDAGRAATHKWDSYETMIYMALKEALNANKTVSVEIPVTPYAIIDIQGHLAFQTHGDTVINVGNPGKSLNVGSISNQINKLNASELGGTAQFALVLAGHVHTPVAHLMDNGCMLLINGTLSGGDPFAQSIGFFSSNPTQTIFEVTKQYAVGDIRFIRLKDADSNKDLDKIIVPYKKPLT